MVEAVLIGAARGGRLIRTLIHVHTLIEPVTYVSIFAEALITDVHDGRKSGSGISGMSLTP